MKIFGLTVGRNVSATEKALVTPVSVRDFFGVVRESFAGAWQRNIEVDPQENLLAFSAVYASVSLIAHDISKLRIRLTAAQPEGNWTEVKRHPTFGPVLMKPNRFQTRIQFLSQWMTMKLLHGNVYIYKERDNRNVVTDLYILDSRRVMPMIADDGSVWYQVSMGTDYKLAGIPDQMRIPASEIIHDRMITLWHPLIGVTPIYACGLAATQGIRIQANSAKFFENLSRPSGQLTAPGVINDVTAKRLKEDFEQKFSGGNYGRMFVAGDGLKYEPIAIPATDAQLIEQLRWTVEDVARCFHVPLHKVASSGVNPTFNNVAALNQDYYNQALQQHIESIEILLDEALGLPALGLGTELDIDGLIRMDPISQATAYQQGINAGWLAPNEARVKQNLPPVKGGDTPYMQQQNWPLEQLAKRPPPGASTGAPPGADSATGNDTAPATQTTPDNSPAAPAPVKPDKSTTAVESSWITEATLKFIEATYA